MAPRPLHEPHDPGPGPGNLYDAPRLAQRLGITSATLRQHRKAGAPWLAAPAGTLNGGLVWNADELRDIEEKRVEMLHPGRAAAIEPTDSDVPSEPQVTGDAIPAVTEPVQDADGWWDADTEAPAT